jgi:hypothetical protein
VEPQSVQHVIASSFSWAFASRSLPRVSNKEIAMHGIIYLIGLVVVILFLLSLLGLR